MRAGQLYRCAQNMAEFAQNSQNRSDNGFGQENHPTEFHRPMPAFISKRFCKSLRRYSFVLWDHTQVFAATVIAAGVKNRVYQSAGSWVKSPLASSLSLMICFGHVAALTYLPTAYDESRRCLTFS